MHQTSLSIHVCVIVWGTFSLWLSETGFPLVYTLCICVNEGMFVTFPNGIETVNLVKQ